MQTLSKKLDEYVRKDDDNFYRSRVPSFIYSNLKSNYGKRSYQQEAFGRFVYYWNEYHERPKETPVQLLYHMATGSGKTLIMAGLIIYLYSKGYRNFLFFVNSANIINKTIDNFFNTVSSKYLFAETVSIDDRQIQIKEVNNFQGADTEDIRIVFSTIQGLHSRLNTPRENSITYDDFENKKIVLISDEAHHINAETKKGEDLGREEKEEIISWERTVSQIFNSNKDNVLLEFTATANLLHPEIQKKYCDKLIYDYPLKQFRIDGFSKEVKVLQADITPFERALQGILLSQYRKKIFEKHQKNIKPVILFKSRTIKDSQSFSQEFISSVKKLRVSDLEKIKHSKPCKELRSFFQYLDANSITLENLTIELKEDFSADKIISVNSKEESVEKQLAINSLEEEDNKYRAIFAVDKLNEGWDVLNLFDIVRLYDTKTTGGRLLANTTMSEAQLIGRGARYCPFKISGEQSLFSRKFDHDLSNELRICEELYYHSPYNPQYIRDLNTALIEIGIKSNEKETPVSNIKKEIKRSSGQKDFLSFIRSEPVLSVTLQSGYTSSGLFFNHDKDERIKRSDREYYLAAFGEVIIRKAMSKLPAYQFSNLKKTLPGLNSVSEFITSHHYLGNIKLKVLGLPERLDHLLPKEKLGASVEVLRKIEPLLSAGKYF